MTTLSLPGWAGQAAYQRSLQRRIPNRSGTPAPANPSNPGNVLGAPVQTFNNPKTSQFATSSFESGGGFDDVGGDLPPPATGPGSNPSGGYADLPNPLPINPFGTMYPPISGAGPWNQDPRIDPSGLTHDYGSSPSDQGGGYFSPQGNYYTFSSPNGWWVGPSGYPAAIQSNNNPSGLPGFQGGNPWGSLANLGASNWAAAGGGQPAGGGTFSLKRKF